MSSVTDTQRPSMWLAEKNISLMLKSCSDLEDLYRSTGLNYHKCTIYTRRSMEFTTEQYERLKSTYEISTPAGYEALFSKLHGVQRRLTALQSEVQHFLLPAPRTVELYNDISSRYLPVAEEFKEVEKFFTTVEQEVGSLYLTNEDLIERRIIWGWERCWEEFITDVQPSPNTPQRMAREYNLLRDWAACLPDTQKIIANGGRTVDDVIADLFIFAKYNGDGFEADPLPEEFHGDSDEDLEDGSEEGTEDDNDEDIEEDSDEEMDEDSDGEMDGHSDTDTVRPSDLRPLLEEAREGYRRMTS